MKLPNLDEDFATIQQGFKELEAAKQALGKRCYEATRDGYLAGVKWPGTSDVYPVIITSRGTQHMTGLYVWSDGSTESVTVPWDQVRGWSAPSHPSPTSLLADFAHLGLNIKYKAVEMPVWLAELEKHPVKPNAKEQTVLDVMALDTAVINEGIEFAKKADWKAMAGMGGGADGFWRWLQEREKGRSPTYSKLWSFWCSAYQLDAVRDALEGHPLLELFDLLKEGNKIAPGVQIDPAKHGRLD